MKTKESVYEYVGGVKIIAIAVGVIAFIAVVFIATASLVCESPCV